MDPSPETWPTTDPRPRPRRARRLTFTPRRLEVLCLLAQGVPTKSIAGRLEIAAKTAEKHRKDLYALTGSGHLPGLTLCALRMGLIDADGRPVPPPSRHSRHLNPVPPGCTYAQMVQTFIIFISSDDPELWPKVPPGAPRDPQTRGTLTVGGEPCTTTTWSASTRWSEIPASTAIP